MPAAPTPFPGEPALPSVVAAWAAPIRSLSRSTAGTLGQADKVSPTHLPTALAADGDQPDLYYLEAVLVTAGLTIDGDRGLPFGWNANDDLFVPLETWQARATPEDKPLNRDHDCHQIVGHVTGCYAETLAGEAIPADAVVLPEDFNLVTQAVLYRVWFDGPENAHDEEREAAVEQLIAEIEQGKWAVSMECLLRDFDYALLAKDGSLELVPRTKNTSHLTDCLRAAGGKGVYQGRRVARVPRKIIFSGKGIVANPANPKSVVRADTLPADAIPAEAPLPFAKTDAKTGHGPPQVYGTATKENRMNETELAAQLAEAQAENRRLKEGKLAELAEALAAEKAARLALEESHKAATESHKAAAESHQAATAQAKAEVEKLVAEKAALEGALAEAKGRLDEMATTAKAAERADAYAAALKLADKAAARAMVEPLAGLSDEAFAAHLDLLAQAVTVTPSPAGNTTTTNNPQGGNAPQGGAKVAKVAPKTPLGFPAKKTPLPAANAGSAADDADAVLDAAAAADPALAVDAARAETVRQKIARAFGYQPQA